jgi:beta-glucosidase
LVSDWAAIDQIDPASYKNAICQCINAGLDMAMIPNAPGKKCNYVEFIKNMKELVAEGKIAVSRIDDAVRRILTVKSEMGLFEHPLRDPALLADVGSKAHRAIGREAVRQSLTLLVNEKKTLPLSKNTKKIFVAGKGADDIGMQCGGWTIIWQGKSGNVLSGGTTILQAVKQTVSEGTAVTYNPDGSGAAGADVGIVVVGEEPYAEMKGDRTDLHLSKPDIAVIEKVKAAGIPVVVVLLSGRPMIVTDVIKRSQAFVAAWLPGTEGQGVADVLFGDYKPTGKLPRAWPKDMTQIPFQPNDKKSVPLFPYGFGLTY